jgi:hypothetical protein
MRLPAPHRHGRVPALDSDQCLSPFPACGGCNSLCGWPSLIRRLTAERSAALAAPLCGAAHLQPKEMTYSLIAC